MPMVPTFQGGIPQVPDSGRTGRMVIDAPRPTVDYESTFQAAIRPLAYGAQAVGKILETEHARSVKAESDEAETKFMQVVQNALYAPETGYMAQREKNAVDAFTPTVEWIQKGAQGILDKLTPDVRAAVESRIQDRFQTARGQMMRWNQAQTDQWHLTSSQSRQKALMDDAAQHYSDKDYLAKTWLSIVQEHDYQAQIAGYDEDTRRQGVAQLYDAFMAQRFQQWANDDPVGAFAASRDEREHMSAKAWDAVDNSLWASSKRQLAYQVAQQAPGLVGKGRVNPKTSTGIPLVDGLSTPRKLEIMSMAGAFVARETAERQGNLKREMENSLALTEQEGTDPNPISRDAFIATYGDKRGEELFSDYEIKRKAAESIFSFRSLSDADMDAAVENLKPVWGSASYAEEAKGYEAAKKARDEVKAERRKDPLGTAIQDQKYQLAPITDWTKAAAFDELGARAREMGTIANDYGVAPVLLRKSEVSELKTMLEGLPPAQQVTMLRRLAASVGPDGESTLGAQLGDDWRNVFLLSIENPAEDKKPADKDSNTPTQADVPELYLTGKQAIAEKDSAMAMITSPQLGVSYYVPKDLNGLYDAPQVRDAIIDSVTKVAAGLARKDGAVGSTTHIARALQLVVGDIYEYQGRKIALKGGLDLSDTETAVKRMRTSMHDIPTPVAYTATGDPLTGPELDKHLATATLVPAVNGAENTFNVIWGDSILFYKNKQPFEIKVWGE